jgi:hypothetical protein
VGRTRPSSPARASASPPLSLPLPLPAGTHGSASSPPPSSSPCATAPARSPATLSPRARAPVWLRRPTSSGPTPLRTLTLALASPEDPQRRRPPFPPPHHLPCATVGTPFHRTPTLESLRFSTTSSPWSS